MDSVNLLSRTLNYDISCLYSKVIKKVKKYISNLYILFLIT